MSPSADVRRAFEGTPGPAETIEVSPGIHWVRMPLPFQLNHINLWLLEDGDGWTVVDTGLGRDEVVELWEQVFAKVLDGRPITRVIVTHFHPDHMGLAGWFCDRFEIDLWTPLGEWTFGRMLFMDHTAETVQGFRRFYGRAGFTPDLLDMVEERGNPYPTRARALPVSIRRIRDGEQISINGRTWRVVIGMGHSPEHACLVCDDPRIVISGDQILPRISPNVSVWPQEPDADPLTLFLDSLKRFHGLADDTLILPSHDWPFTGLQARVDVLAHHHDQRLEETVRACAEPCTAVDVLRRLFKRELDSHQLVFAVGESLAHLHHLMSRGLIRRQIGPDGVDRFIQA